MNLQGFEYVRTFAREGSFTRAAERLHVTQQTLSAHVAALERELGRPLFSRGTPLVPTHEGQAFLRHAEKISGQLRDLRREVCAGGPEQEGTLRVGVACTRGRALLPPVMERLCELYPNVCVELQEDTNEAVCERLAEGGADVAIPTSTAGRDARIRLVPYYEEEVVLVATSALLGECGIDRAQAQDALARGDLSALAGCPLVLGGPSDMSGGLGLGLFSAAAVPAVHGHSPRACRDARHGRGLGRRRLTRTGAPEALPTPPSSARREAPAARSRALRRGRPQAARQGPGPRPARAPCRARG